MGLRGKPDPAIPQLGSLALTTVLRVCACSSEWTDRSHLCGAAHVGVPVTWKHRHRGLFSDSIGVRKLVELLKEGLAVGQGGKDGVETGSHSLSLNFLISEMALLKDQQYSGENT